MNKSKAIFMRMVLTFLESAGAYWTVLGRPTLRGTVLSGVVGAGVSAVFNYLLESTPTTGNAGNTQSTV